MNVTATTLRLEADDAIGTAARHLTTTVTTISASSTGTDAQGIYVTEADSDHRVDSISASATTAFNTDGSTSTLTDAAQADLVSGNNGDIVLTTLAGSIVINDGDSDSLGVVANGSGNVRIDANGTGSDVTNNAQINSSYRPHHGDGSGCVEHPGEHHHRDQRYGNVRCRRQQPQPWQAPSAVTATNSSARLNAATDLTVGNVTAANVSFVADSGSIVNAD